MSSRSYLRPASPVAFLALLLFAAATTASSATGCGGEGAAVNDASTTQDGSNIPGDNDGDGYPAAEDCDDTDPTIYPGVTRDCESDCDVGVETCLATGEWSVCSAATDCICDSPGDTRVVDCGNCGEASQECGLDLIWEFPGDCLNEGICNPGTTEDATCTFCGTRSRLCNNECIWGDWDTTGCYGDCAPGTEDATPGDCDYGQTQPLLCSTECGWENNGDCNGDCVGTPRTGTPDYKDEVCIPGGLSLRGADPGEESTASDLPEHIVALNPYFIDVYEVTVARYRECVTDGGCTEPVSYLSTYLNGSPDIFPVTGIDWDRAVEFCAWDGGRTLPTEAQWEKAARGPYPADPPNPWGSDPATCTHVPAYNCTNYLVAADGCPDGVSAFGLHQLGGNAQEWVADWFGPYPQSTGPLIDPVGPASGMNRVIRGMVPGAGLANFQFTVTRRVWSLPDSDSGWFGIRCARPGL
ncbi:MAG: SUMF1/EgtB/PvdO family nonheme iron enzyme [bacterium]